MAAFYADIVVLQLVRQDKPHVLGVLERLLPQFVQETLVGKLWIVDETSIRIRD